MCKKILSFILLSWLVGCAPAPPPASSPSPGETAHEREHEHEHEEKPGHVTLGPDLRKASGIVVEAVALRDLGGEFVATGTLTHDLDLQVRVTPRLNAKLQSMQASLGDHVRTGQVLAVLDCPELVKLKSDYHESETNYRLALKSYQRRSQLAEVGDEIRRPFEEARNEVTTAKGEMRVAEANLDVVSKKHKRVADLLQDGITSVAQLEQAQGELRQADARARQARSSLRIAEAHLQRERRVSSLGLLANRELQEAAADVERTRERTMHLKEGLEALQADPESHGSTMVVTSPIDGMVTARPASLGQSVTPDSELFTVADTRKLWLWVNVLEQNLAALRTGLVVETTVSAYPNETFRGTISYIAPELDEKTRTARALVVIPNPARKLRPSMYATVRVETGGNEKSLAVPKDAVQKVEGADVVYVNEEGDEFVRRPVVVGSQAHDFVQITSGLKPADRVVVKGAFLVKTQDLKSTIEEEH